jgi:hypothetical protein
MSKIKPRWRYRLSNWATVEAAGEMLINRLAIRSWEIVGSGLRRGIFATTSVQNKEGRGRQVEGGVSGEPPGPG